MKNSPPSVALIALTSTHVDGPRVAALHYESAMGRARILIVEHDNAIRSVLEQMAAAAEYERLHASTGYRGLQLYRETAPDLILLDLDLPDLDGGDLLRHLRRTSSVPVIVVTARRSTADAIRLLNLGADDFIATPAHPLELLARIRVQLRRRPGDTNGLGRIRLDLRSRLVRVDGTALDLSPKEFKLLALLVQSAGAVVTRAEIRDALWPGSLADHSTVIDAHVSNLRRKLRVAAEGDLVRVVYGMGYALNT